MQIPSEDIQPSDILQLAADQITFQGHFNELKKWGNTEGQSCTAVSGSGFQTPGEDIQGA